jgi:hypothetical protein
MIAAPATARVAAWECYLRLTEAATTTTAVTVTEPGSTVMIMITGMSRSLIMMTRDSTAAVARHGESSVTAAMMKTQDSEIRPGPSGPAVLKRPLLVSMRTGKRARARGQARHLKCTHNQHATTLTTSFAVREVVCLWLVVNFCDAFKPLFSIVVRT